MSLKRGIRKTLHGIEFFAENFDKIIKDGKSVTEKYKMINKKRKFRILGIRNKLIFP